MDHLLSRIPRIVQGRVLALLAALVLMALPAMSTQQSAPRVGLVLSGGGGRGFSHIGVLRELERQHIPLYCIVGTSMGAVVGGLYASGYSPAEIDSLLGRYSWGDLFEDRPDRRLMYTGRKEVSDRHVLEVRLNGLKLQWARSLSTGQRVSQALAEMVWRAPLQSFGDFDRLRVRFRAVATNLETGSRVDLGGGDLAEAMRASMSVPILFQPVQLDGRRLIDGGISANIPVETARNLGADLVIVVDTTSPLRRESDLREAWEMADQVVTIMQAETNRASLLQADLVLRPASAPGHMNDLDRREALEEEGARAVRDEVDHLRRLLRPAAGGEGAPVEAPRPARTAGNPPVLAVTGLEPLRQAVSARAWQAAGADSLLACVAREARDPARLDSLLETLVVRLRRAGFTLCNLDSLALDGDTLRVVLDPGRLDALRVDGLTRLRPSVLLREFRPRAGEVFQVQRADRSIGRLYATGLYNQVYLRLERENRRNVAVLHADEKAFPALRLGLRYGSAREGEGFFQALWENLLGRSLRGDLSWLAGARRGEQRATLESDRLWRTWLTTRLSARRGTSQFWLEGAGSPLAGGQRAQVRRESRALELRLGQQIQGLGSVHLSGALEWDEEESAGARDTRSLARLGLLSLVDSRDRPDLPRRGEYHRVVFEQLVPRGERGPTAFRAAAEFDSWRSLGRHTGQLSLLAGRTDSRARRDHFELGGDDWLRSVEPSQVAGRQALGARARWRVQAWRGAWGEWSASLRWSALALSGDLEGWPARRDLTQEAALALHLASRLGPLEAGLARVTEAGPASQPGFKVWVDLGYSF